MPDTTFHPPASLTDLLNSADNELAHLRENSTWAVYTRLSVFDPEHPGYSLETQPDQAEAYARTMNATNIIVYSDPDRSGGNSQRPAFQQMYRDIVAGRIDAVVVHRIDRLYRNLESLLRFIRILRRHHVHLYSATEQIDTKSIWGRLTLAVLGHLAEAYLYQTSTNTRLGLQKRGESGKNLGRLPLGYCNGLCSTCTDAHGPGYCPLVGSADRVESQRGTIAVPHPIDRHIIPIIFESYRHGSSFREIAVALNGHEISLPDDGTLRQFRPRTGSTFRREAIRAILENPFYAGLIARYPRPEFNTDDDLEHPENVPPARVVGNSRKPLALYPGLHEALISVEAWDDAAAVRAQKSTTPATTQRTVEYSLTGVARCWECLDAIGLDFNLRGSRGKNWSYYRCGHLHDIAIQRSPGRQHLSGTKRVRALPDTGLAKRHATLRSNQLESQVDDLMTRLTLPVDWHEMILALYITDAGLGQFERETYNLRQSLSRFRDLYQRGDIDAGEYERQSRFILGRLAALQPSVRPEAREIAPLLLDFPALWRTMSSGERRTVLKTLFSGLYFDRDGRLRRAVAYEPFNKLLNLPEGGVLIP